MELSNKGYEDFGLWNALEILESGSSVNAIVEGHAGDFHPETPEDYLKVLFGPLNNDWPVRADIDITNICNHDCPFCFSQFDRSMQPQLSMDKELFLRTVKELVSRGTKSIRFCGGGEPLAHPNSFEMMNATLQHPVHVTLLTNGDLFTEKYQNIFLRQFVCIRFSFDSYDAESRAVTHGTSKNSFAKLLKNITYFNERRYKANLIETTKVGASYLLHPGNISGLLEIARLLKNIGLDYVAFRRIVGENFAVDFSPEIESTVKAQLTTIKDELEDDSFKIFVTVRPLTDTGAVPSMFFDKCMVSRVRVIIEATGAVQMCPRARGEKSWRTLGVVNINRTFEDVWNSGIRCQQQQRAPLECADCIDISSNKTLCQIVRAAPLQPIRLGRLMR